MNNIKIEKPAEYVSTNQIEMDEIFSYDAYMQFMEDSADILVDNAANY